MFGKVILPLAMPGVLAGSMLVFIPRSVTSSTPITWAAPDQDDRQRHPAAVPGGQDYPAAAALSFVLMALILVGVLIYTRALGTEDLV